MSISGKDLSSFSLYSIKISNNSCEGFQFGRSIINQRYFKKFPVKENWNFYLEPAKREKKKKSIYFFCLFIFSVQKGYKLYETTCSGKILLYLFLHSNHLNNFYKNIKKKSGSPSLEVFSNSTSSNDFMMWETNYFEPFKGCLRIIFHKIDNYRLPMAVFLYFLMKMIFLKKSLYYHRFSINLYLEITKNHFI